jgi:hypothetical protein
MVNIFELLGSKILSTFGVARGRSPSYIGINVAKIPRTVKEFDLYEI